MNNDPILTLGFYAITIFLFVIVYLLPVTTIITGIVLLRKKPKNKSLGLAVTIIGVVLLLGVLIWKVANTYYIAYYGDEYAHIARQLNPLGKRQQYIITPNLETIDGNDGTIIPADTYYTFFPVGEDRGNPPDKILGRIISDQTTIDFTSYLNKPVYIWGEFQHGLPMFIQQATNSGLLIGNEVLVIEKIELVN
ncbi:hypothetical protein FWH30_01045 [Microgenomates group bacterium]|nr:hypothetical protein [Microgenomates group bacterium]